MECLVQALTEKVEEQRLEIERLKKVQDSTTEVAEDTDYNVWEDA